MGHLLGYARVSTTDQDPALQHDALTKAGCYRIFTDTASGATTTRPALAQVLDQLRPGDTLVVWRLDRLGRSTSHLVNTIHQLTEQGIGFHSLTEAIDTNTPTGMLLAHLLAAITEFERQLIIERTRAGLASAKTRGRTGGRPPKMTPEKLAVAHHMRDHDKATLNTIANTIGVSRTTLIRHLTPQTPR